MRFRFLAAMTGATAACTLGGVGVAVGGGDDDGSGHRSDRGTLFAELSGRNEISPQTGKRNAGDPDGSGGATVTIDGTALCFGITVKNIDQPQAAHIHRGRRNENGPIVVGLAPPSSGDPGASSGCTTVSAELAAEIARHPRGFYVNVHTAAFPGGAVRGQLSKE
jgi:CHRD domain